MNPADCAKFQQYVAGVAARFTVRCPIICGVYYQIVLSRQYGVFHTLLLPRASKQAGNNPKQHDS